jgi:dihydrofolate reductase
VGQVLAAITMSLDGYVAGPNASLDEPLGQGGEELHEWAMAAHSWRERHGQSGGTNDVDSDVLDEIHGNEGATIVGRKMFSGGSGSWEDDPMANSFWGDDPPFHHPVFVITHHEREPLQVSDTKFTFVTDGIESALEQARAAAADQDVLVAGGAEVIDQYLRTGLVDELHLHVAPRFLGGGARLFSEDLSQLNGKLKRDRVLESSSTGVVHLRYRLS